MRNPPSKQINTGQRDLSIGNSILS